jgi:hypothetical protein
VGSRIKRPLIIILLPRQQDFHYFVPPFHVGGGGRENFSLVNPKTPFLAFEANWAP